jgi:hypothetical protein
LPASTSSDSARPGTALPRAAGAVAGGVVHELQAGEVGLGEDAEDRQAQAMPWMIAASISCAVPTPSSSSRCTSAWMAAWTRLAT